MHVEEEISDLSPIYEKIKNLPGSLTEFTEDQKQLLFMMLLERAQMDTLSVWLIDVLQALTGDIEAPVETMPVAAKRLLTDSKANNSFKQVRDIVGMLDTKLKKSIHSMMEIEVMMEKEARQDIHSWLLSIRTHVDSLTALIESDPGGQR